MYGLDIHNKKVMTAVVRKLRPSGGYIGQNYFPSTPVNGEVTVWDIIDPLDNMAKIRAQDSEAFIHDRDTFSQAEASLVDIAGKERFNTSDLRVLREAGELPVEMRTNSTIGAMAEKAARAQRDALVRLRQYVDNRVEQLRIDALQGVISYNANGVDFSVNYGIPTDQSAQVPSTLWSDPASTPMEDIQDWDKIVNDRTGTHFGEMICSTATLMKLTRNSTFRDTLKYTNPMFVSVSRVKEFIQNELQIAVTVYDSQFATGKGNSKVYSRYLNEDRIILLPRKDQLGPEGLGDLAVTGHPHNQWNPGYYSWTEEKKDPYAVYVGVGLMAFPRLMQPRAIFTADIA